MLRRFCQAALAGRWVGSPEAALARQGLPAMLPSAWSRGVQTEAEEAGPSQPASPSARFGSPSEAGKPKAPWTPSQDLVKRKALPKRMGFMLRVLEDEAVDKAMKERNIPNFGPGAVIELKLTTPENKRRSTTFRGLCIAKSSRAMRSTFTLRNFIGPAALERTFPLFSPHIQDIKVLDTREVRRAKLYYLRNRVPREYRVA